MTLDPGVTKNLFLLLLVCFSAGAVGALVTVRRANLSRMVGHGLALVGAVAALALAAAGLMGGHLEIYLPEFLPLGGGVMLGLDRTSAFFVLVIAVGAIPATLYAIGYTREYQGKHSIAALGAALNVFLAAMLLVTMARNVITFLFLWEVMSLISYFLVTTESQRPETERAGLMYFVMTHAGFAFLLVGFLLLASATGTMNFAEWNARVGGIDTLLRDVIFILLAMGFGSKAGIIPLHIWLPRAHPAAPSHVSALMSGVMIKLGVYGLVRVGFEWLGVADAWWGGAVLILAAISAVVGVLYAMVDADLKRLLAYSSVENIGIILLGVGAAMLFQSFGLGALAALALLAALLHALNHAAFKSLLFMGAGAILHAAHTRNLEKMGGLIKRMPQTAALFLVGAVAIAALPPFNGFISEWLTFQALLSSYQIPALVYNLLFAVAIAALALTGGLAAAAFVKAFGISFLALPRSEQAEHAHEVDGWMRAGMAILAVLCFVLGVAPFLAIEPLEGVTAELVGTRAALTFDWDLLVANKEFATVSPFWIAAGLGIFLVAIPIGLRIMRANTRRRYYETWACGRAVQTSRFEYTATAFANPFKRVFGMLYRPVKQLDIEFHPESRFFVRIISYRNETRSIVEDALYGRLWRALRWLAREARVIQSGNVHIYLFYIFVALIALLILTR
jgi:hydrogenase-4 component B